MAIRKKNLQCDVGNQRVKKEKRTRDPEDRSRRIATEDLQICSESLALIGQSFTLPQHQTNTPIKGQPRRQVDQ